LTQGWSSFNWERMLSFKDAPRFAAETDFEVNGRVTNMLNKPVADSKITLFSSNPLVVREALSGAKGDFHFAGFPQIDTAAVFLLSAFNKRGKMNNVGIEITDKKALPSSTVHKSLTYPWFVNAKIDLQKKVQERYVQRQNEWKIDPNNRLLNEVVVTAKKIIKESKNLNGPGESDQVLDEVTMANSGKKMLMQVLQERVPGFREYTVPKTGQRIFRLSDRMAHFIFDGMDIDFFFNPDGGMPDAHYQYVKQYLDYYTAEDIRGIEVMKSSGNSASYVSRYIQNPMASPADHAFIEITTRSGKGAFVKHTPGSFLYKPTPFVQNRDFYRPKYPVKTRAKGAVDNRVTLHWEPNIITDEKGEAQVSFYTSDQKGTYRIILEGADMLGGVGSATEVIGVRGE
ncbi:MAG: carboxypeptidase regulatory-like domain-containing protein, partial [Mucilaginibacter polytrichastri]|nr:carboxypeptidase regulatory-like domain-containing protein [Mucilaginibacter polytrichastri]